MAAVQIAVENIPIGHHTHTDTNVDYYSQPPDGFRVKQCCFHQRVRNNTYARHHAATASAVATNSPWRQRLPPLTAQVRHAYVVLD